MAPRDQGAAVVHVPRSPADHLALARVERDAGVLRRLVRCPYPFVWHALAANPHTPPDALLDLCSARDSGCNDNRLLYLLAGHPAADGAVLRAVLDAVAGRLAAGERPFAAVLALAERAELPADDVWRLGALPGASARLRGGLRRRLAAR